MNENKSKTDSLGTGDESAATAAVSEIPAEKLPSNGKKAAAEEQTPQQRVNIDDSSAIAFYANFCRVSTTPEELILDLGMNPNPYRSNGTTINISQRIIVNHFTAKRLLSALSMSIQRHEQAFGVLETDVRKRVQQK